MKEFLEYQKDIANLEYTINLLSWELKINAPIGSNDDLINLISSYEKKLFELSTNEKYGKLLNDTINRKEYSLLEEAEKRYSNNLQKHYENYKKVPQDFYLEYAKTQKTTNIIWKEAKEKKDYNMFKPYLENMIELTKKYYRFLEPNSTNIYDVMLNKYEMGINTKIIDRLFSELKEGIKDLIPESTSNVTSITYNYTNEELINVANYLLEYIGFDLKRGTLGIYPHGFTEKIATNDIRIAFSHTTDPIDFVMTIIHEGGHAIFEQNIKENLSKYENSTIENLYALHESQSRFYENMLGRNKNFWMPIYNDIKEMLHLDMDIDEFVKLLNTPKCNAIRCISDELTYCMHIILRYEIEKDIFNNKIKVSDIPNEWNKKTKEYLHVDIRDDSEGLMQDVHWSEGSFGYFPSYLIGSIYDGMFLETIGDDLGNIDELLKSGNIKKITKYLIDNIYVNGGAYSSKEILNKICKKELTSEPLIKYFKKKYK